MRWSENSLLQSSAVKSRALAERAELPEKAADTESQPHSHTLKSPFLVSSPEAFCQVSWKRMGWREKKGLTQTSWQFLSAFPPSYWPGKELEERFYSWACNCEIIVWAGLGRLCLKGCIYLNRCGVIQQGARTEPVQPNPEVYYSINYLFIKIQYFPITTIQHHKQHSEHRPHVGAVWEHLAETI